MEQNFKNHVKFDPRFHYFVAPVLLLNVLVAIVLAVRYWPLLHWLGFWLVIVAAAILVAAGLVRDYGLKNQDRIIRLEERLRYATLMAPAAAAALGGLSSRQVVALRFASDGELQPLAQRALEESLKPKQIKESIQVWRPDPMRV